MLVLSRNLSESILIGDNIRITILNRDGDRIKVGIEAPRDLVVIREELQTKTSSTPRAFKHSLSTLRSKLFS